MNASIVPNSKRERRGMKDILTLWHRLDAVIQKVEQWLIVVGLMVILIFGVMSILLRNTVGWGLAFADILSRQITVWLGLLGASLATVSAEHISIDAFSRMLKKDKVKVNRVAIGIMCIIGNGIMTYCAIMFLMFYINKPVDVDFGGFKVTNWKLLVIFPLAFALITFRTLIQTIEVGLALKGVIIPGSLEEERYLQELEDEREAEAATQASQGTQVSSVSEDEDEDLEFEEPEVSAETEVKAEEGGEG